MIKRKPGFSGKMFWSLEIPFNTGFTVYIYIYIVIGIVSRYVLDDSGFESRQREETFLFTISSKPTIQLTPTYNQWFWFSFLGIRRSGSAGYKSHSPSSSMYLHSVERESLTLYIQFILGLTFFLYCVYVFKT